MPDAVQTAPDRAPRGTFARVGGRFESLSLVRPPQPLTSFVGREPELVVVSGLLRDDAVRLLTLTGPGGVGKTRLALRLAEEMGAAFADGVAFVPLATVADPGLVLGAIAQGLGTRETGDQTPFERIRFALRNRRLLLVLDNFEQVGAAAAEVARLIGECPGLKALVTSRVPLHVAGEQEFALPPLTLPTVVAASPTDLAANPAVALFVQRAQAVRPTFALHAENAAAVGDVCRRLDGLPLAIELAAARTKVLAPSALLARLGHGLEVLTGGPRDQPERLQTLRAAIAWTYDLLTENERALFRRLAVFAGGITLEAAETVGGDGVAPTPSVLDLVGSLVDSSLLRQEEGGDGEPRFGMLETIREFGLEVLAGSGEEAEVRGAHAAWFLALTERAEPDMGPAQGYWLGLLETEHPNLRAALGWFIGRGDAPAALGLAGALWPFWFFHNHFDEGASWLERALALPGDQAAGARGVALLGAGILASVRGDFDRARAWHEEGLALARERSDPTGQGRALFGIGGVARHQGADEEAAAALLDALALFRTTGDQSWMASTLNSLGNVAHRQGDLERASAYGDEALALSRAIGERWSTAEALAIGAVVAHDRGEVAGAASLWAESLAVYTELRDRRAIARTVAGLAVSAVADRQPARAIRLFAASEAMQDAIGGSVIAMRRSWYQPRLAQARAMLGEDAFAAEWDAGRVLTVEAVIAEAAAVVERLHSGSTTAREGSGARTLSPAAPFGLSPREVEVLGLLVAGQTDREIGAALFISPRTAQGHVARLFAKLGVSTRTAAVAVAFQSGLLAETPTEP